MALILFFLLQSLMIQSAFAIEISVGTYVDHIDAIEAYTEQNGCADLEQAGVGENQILAEYLIFCNALSLSAGDYQIKLVPYPVNARLLGGLNKGSVHASAIGIWNNEVKNPNLALTPPLFRNNEFVKGLYTLAPLAERFTDPERLKKAVVLANQNWHVDWALLKCAEMNLLHVNRYEYMFNMLKRQRGDIIPLTFSNRPDMERRHFGVSLYPVEGYKMVFVDSTHFVVNPESDIGATLLEHLRSGLRQLRDRNAITSMYKRLGIIQDDTHHWISLGCDH